ncbi:uncharacterized protein LOC132543488 [Ylistrum balloti]|uniref:uncharacterized protein LOC132543488 n=1 Tax=Ylistrum balloti TaxID=509963 RepID=UPI002905AF6C|nr:uncharacterized protein LOC132543488 [Ylistrum balloti]
MSGGTQMEGGQLLKCGDGEFEKSIQGMTLKNLLDTISMLQKEMGREQATFNSLSAQLASLNKNSRQYKQISKEMNTSQTRLTMLMNRSMKCFQQQGNQHVKTPAPAPPGVQRHSSNVEQKEGSSGNNVQRRHSAKISATEGENIKSGFDAKTTTQNTGPKKPVILQPIVNNGKMPSNGHSGSKVSTANCVSDTSTVSTSVSSVVKTTVSPPVTSLTNSTSSTAKTSSTKSVGITPVKNTTPVTSSSDGAKSTSILNVGVKNTVQNLERKSVVNMPKVITNGAAARSTTSNTSGVVKPNSDKTVISVTSSSSKSIVTSVVTKSTTTVSKTVSSGTKSVTSSVQESSETKKIPEAPVAPTLKKVSQPSKYSRPPINQPVDPREQMLSEIRNFKRPANASEVEPLRKSVTEVKLGITQGRQDQQKKVATIPQQKAVPVSAQQKAVPVSAQQKKTAPFSVPQMSNVASPAENQQVTSSVSVKTISSEKTKETEKKEKEIVVLESKSSGDQTVRLEQIKVSDDKIVEDKPKVTQVSTKVSDNSEAESEIPALMTTEDSTESEGEQSEKYVSSVTFTHKPLKSAEAVKPKTKVLSSASSADVTPGPPTAAVTTPAEPKQVDAKYDLYISPEEKRGVALEKDDDDEVVPSRINMRDWNPTKLLVDLYTVKLAKEEVEDLSDKFVGMEGLMEKLPMNKKKATLLKTWKRRFFRAKDGWLHYFETNNHERPSDSVQLMGGHVEDLGNRILGIDDGRGRFLMVRCPTDKEYGQWKLALESQTVDNVRATYVRPVLKSPPNPRRKVVLIDIGSCSIRAGILGQEASLPELFFPSIVARNKDSSDIRIGIQAYHPDVRKTSTLMKAVRPTSKMDKSEVVDHMKAFNVDTEVMPAVLDKIFTDLNIDPSKYWIMMSTPQNLADQLKAALFEILIGQFRVKGICMVMQSLLALYSYQKTSGILVDIGQRMEILPICDGYVIEGGVSRQSYGGQKVEDCLNSSLTENKYVFGTPVEELILRHIMEQSCLVAEDYNEMEKKCSTDPESCQSTVFLNKYDLPEGSHREVVHNRSCYHSSEGFFNTDLWGMDYPCVHKLVFKAIQYCPIDSRKEMYRAIYLSGGVTMLPGFAERLQKELIKLAPPSVIVEVHAAPQRYHAAYIGACSLANMDMFEQSCITGDEWAKNGVKAFAKWAMQSS